jgi:hypothetical protein
VVEWLSADELRQVLDRALGHVVSSRAAAEDAPQVPLVGYLEAQARFDAPTPDRPSDRWPSSTSSPGFVRQVRGRRTGHSGTGGTDRGTCRHRALPLGAHSDVPGCRAGHRRPGAAAPASLATVYAAIVGAAVVAFVYLYEESTLTQRYGAGYIAYQAVVATVDTAATRPHPAAGADPT